MKSSRSDRRHFTAAAREAALKTRRLKKEMGIKPEIVSVFATRLESAPRDFGWEIRQFGGVILERSEEPYPSAKQALAAGKKALGDRNGPK